MYMGKKLLLAAAMAGIVSGSAFAEDQGSGKIKFKGVVIDAPCSLTIQQTKPTRQLPKWMSHSPAQRQTRQTPA